MVTTPLARAGILKSLKKAKIVKISGKLFFHRKIEYPKLQIPRKTKNSVFEQISGLPPPIISHWEMMTPQSAFKALPLSKKNTAVTVFDKRTFHLLWHEGFYVVQY